MEILNEISQFGFIMSIIYVIFVVINFFLRMYGRFKLGKDTVFVMSTWEKYLLLISIGYILSYLI